VIRLDHHKFGHKPAQVPILEELLMSQGNNPNASLSTERVLSADARKIFTAFEQPDRLAATTRRTWPESRSLRALSSLRECALFANPPTNKTSTGFSCYSPAKTPETEPDAKFQSTLAID